MDNFALPYKKFQKLVDIGKNILIASHINPDPDAYGSMIGLGLVLKELGKNVYFFNSSGLVKRFLFFNQFIEGDIISDTKDISSYNIDLIIVCDSANLKRIGDEALKFFSSSPLRIINIDHHYTNSNYGELNIVNDNYSSTSEIVFALCKLSGWHINSSARECFLAGLMGDTNCFTTTSTTVNSFKTAIDLIEGGANLTKVVNGLFLNKPLKSVKLQGQALAEIALYQEGKIALLEITSEMIDRHKAEKSDTEGLVEAGLSIEGVLISALIREDKDEVKVSLRSKSPDIDVSLTAKRFGGGGHKQAAAFRVKGGDYVAIKSQLLDQLSLLL